MRPLCDDTHLVAGKKFMAIGTNAALHTVEPVVAVIAMMPHTMFFYVYRMKTGFHSTCTMSQEIILPAILDKKASNYNWNLGRLKSRNSAPGPGVPIGERGGFQPP